MIIKNKLMSMFAFMFLVVSVLPTQVGAIPPPQGSTTPSISCYNFSTDFYYGMTIPPVSIQQYRSTITNPAYLIYAASITKLHQILEAEGYPIPSDEKNKKFGKVTATSLVKYQTVQKVAIGEEPNGIFTEKTRNVVNQKYGCISKATINLTEPNANSVRARGEVVAIKWDAAKIPNTTDVTIQYVTAQNTATTTIATQSGVRNGKGQYNWTVPSTMSLGQYKILVSLTGAAKSDTSAKSFEIRDKALEITSPTIEVQVAAGSKLPVTWKTSTAIKPADKIKVSLVGTLVSGTAASTTIELGRVVNNGALTWTVPDRVNNRVVTGTSTFNIVLQTESGLHTSTSSSVVKIVPKTVATSVVPPATVAPKITVWNIMTQKVRGNPIIVNWTTNTSFGSSARVYAKLMRTNGSVETEVARTSSVTPYTNSITLTIPAKAVASATATTNDYKVVLVVTGLPSGVSLDATSDITTDSFSVATQGQNATVTAQTNIPTADAGVVYKGSPLTINTVSTGIPSGTSFTAKIIKVTGQTTSVALTAIGKFTSNATNVVINIPTSLANGTYKVQISTTVDTQPIDALTSTFEVRDRPVVLPKITIGAVPTAIERGVPLTVTWTSNSAVPTTSKVHIELVNANTGTRMNYLASSALASRNTAEITIPTSTPVNGNYKIRIVPISGLANIDNTSILESNSFSVTFKSGQISAKTNRITSAAPKGSPITVEFTGTAPASTRLTLNLMKADGTAVSGVPNLSTYLSVGQAKFNIPATLATGQYKIGVSGIVDTNLVSTTTPIFEVVPPYVSFIDSASQNGITKTNGQNGSTTAISATFEMQVVANGGTFTKPLPSNLNIVFENTVTGATFSPSKIVVSGSNIAKDSSGGFIIQATLDTSKFASNTSGTYRAKVVKMTYTFNGVATTKTEDLGVYVTPTITLVR